MLAMTAGTLAERLGWDAIEDLSLNPDSAVTILDDGTVNAIENGALISGVAKLTRPQVRKLERSQAASVLGRRGGLAGKRAGRDYAALGRKGGAAGKGKLKPRS
jgi:hypothetical protein